MKFYQERHRRCDNLMDDDGVPGGSPTTLGYVDQHSGEHQSEQVVRTRKIEARRAQADLLRAATTEITLSTQVWLALRDLDEAAWLNATGRLGSEASAGLVDALLIVAGRRLDSVRTLLG